jgi:hypothetical protein
VLPRAAQTRQWASESASPAYSVPPRATIQHDIDALPVSWSGSSEELAALRDERDRLLALGVGDHLPYELALRISELDERRRTLVQLQAA